MKKFLLFLFKIVISSAIVLGIGHCTDKVGECSMVRSEYTYTYTLTMYNGEKVKFTNKYEVLFKNGCIYDFRWTGEGAPSLRCGVSNCEFVSKTKNK